MAIKPTLYFSIRLRLGLMIAGLVVLLGCSKTDTDGSRSLNPSSKSSQSANSSSETTLANSAIEQNNLPIKKANASTNYGPQPLAKGLVSDDGKTVWVRPTNGSKLDLSGVAEGSETVLLIRPQSLLASEEGKRFWRALGPAGEIAQKSIEASEEKKLNAINRLVISLGPGDEYGEPLTTVVAEPTKTDEVPLLRREIELLADALDDEAHFNFLFSPKFLLGDGGAMFRDQWLPLRRLLTDLAGDDWQAASLSLHLDKRFYWELRVVGTAATQERTLARALGQESASWPDRLKQLIAKQEWSDYSQAILDRSPEMMNLLAKYARYGVERRQTILNGYLPQSAAHNLALSGELFLAGFGQRTNSESLTETAAKSPQTLLDRLDTPISLQFRRESLETALQLLSDTTNIPITLGGRDLQLEGITRNQMLGLDQKQKPANEVLLEILRRANPDPLASGATDERQKLVYILRNPESEKGSIHVTTRSAAKSRGEKLPQIFSE